MLTVSIRDSRTDETDIYEVRQVRFVPFQQVPPDTVGYPEPNNEDAGLHLFLSDGTNRHFSFTDSVDGLEAQLFDAFVMNDTGATVARYSF